MACSFEASWNTPITSDGREGFVDFLFPAVTTFFPAIHIGYSCPNSAFTFASAASICLRFSAFEKSINGSFVNSGTCNFASAVAMVVFLLAWEHLIIGRLLHADKQTRFAAAIPHRARDEGENR